MVRKSPCGEGCQGVGSMQSQLKERGVATGKKLKHHLL